MTTQWTRVVDAQGHSPEARAALSELCEAYYGPVLAYIRHQVRAEEEARDLAQEFFAGLLAKGGLAGADPRRGRFRAYLSGAVKHFLADMRDRSRRLKRGGGCATEPLEPGTDTSPGALPEDPQAPNPEHEFDRKWALTVLARALGTLASEHADNGKAEQFEALKPWLTGDLEGASQTQAAARLRLNDGAVKVAIHRLRRRFREAIKTEISQTLSAPESVDEELRALIAALG